jgi:hypothetical protein
VVGGEEERDWRRGGNKKWGEGQGVSGKRERERERERESRYESREGVLGILRLVRLRERVGTPEREVMPTHSLSPWRTCARERLCACARSQGASQRLSSLLEYRRTYASEDI